MVGLPETEMSLKPVILLGVGRSYFQSLVVQSITSTVLVTSLWPEVVFTTPPATMIFLRPFSTYVRQAWFILRHNSHQQNLLNLSYLGTDIFLSVLLCSMKVVSQDSLSRL